MLRLTILDGCVVPRPLKPILKKLQRETGCSYNSLYRGQDAAHLLHKLGKHTQGELYRRFLEGRGAPANPPNVGTHILRGDGVVGRYGRKLPWWRCGIDVNDSDVHALKKAARRHGWVLYQPYNSPSEFHHLNFARKPKRWRAFYRNFYRRHR